MVVARGWGSQGWGARWVVRSFFSLSCRKMRSFLPSLGLFSWNFGVCLKSSRLRPQGTRVSHDSLRAQTCIVEGPGLQKQTPPNFQQEDTQRDRKRAKFWAVQRRAVRGRRVRRTHTHTPTHPTHSNTHRYRVLSRIMSFFVPMSFFLSRHRHKGDEGQK